MGRTSRCTKTSLKSVCRYLPVLPYDRQTEAPGRPKVKAKHRRKWQANLLNADHPFTTQICIRPDRQILGPSFRDMRIDYSRGLLCLDEAKLMENHLRGETRGNSRIPSS